MNISMILMQRDSGIYYAVYRENGRQRWKSLRTRDKTIAKKLYNQFKKLYLEGKITRLESNLSDISVTSFKKEYLDYIETTKTSNTYYSAKFKLQKFISFCGAELPLKSINSKMIDQYVISCKNAGNRLTTINSDLRTLKGAFNKAIEYGYIKENPIKKLLKVDKLPPKSISPDDFKKLISGIDDSLFRSFVYFIIYTGCRKNEALNITWSNVNLDKGYLVIETAKSREFRQIPISDKLRKLLETLPSEVGKLFPWSSWWAGRKFKNYADQTGVKVTLHGLRHTFATILANSETPLRVLQDLMGHKDIQSTMVYISAVDKSKHEAINKIDL